jgi:RNA recognition motif-containing protein
MSTAADNLADTLANTSINDTNDAAQVDAAAASADEGRRLYIGNLAYATTEGQLKEFFTGYTM